MKKASFYFSGLTFKIVSGDVTKLYPCNKPIVGDAANQYRPVSKSADMKVSFCAKHAATSKFADGLGVVTHNFRTVRRNGKKRREEKFYVSTLENGKLSSRLLPFTLPQVLDPHTDIPGAPYNGEIVFVTKTEQGVGNVTRIRDEVKLALNDFNAKIDEAIEKESTVDPAVNLYTKLNELADVHNVTIASITVKKGKVVEVLVENDDGPVNGDLLKSVVDDVKKVIETEKD